MNSLRLELEQYVKGIRKGDRVTLARAITLVESTLSPDQELAGEVLDAVVPHTGKSLRLGITGAPGVGKSSFIESFGETLIESGKKVAVLTIDPSSQITGGSILGDKTRMPQLSKDPRAFVRPSPAGQMLGGVAAHTRESILLCEAAGFDRVIVETVGTGQSETAIRNMVDFFLLLMQPGTGDELQGIKKGIVEMADAIAVTKADGDNLQAAKIAQSDFQHALHLQQTQPYGWTPKVITCSAFKKTGLREIERLIEDFKARLTESGHFQANRRNQHTAWFRDHFNYLLSIDARQFPTVREAEREMQSLVQKNEISPRNAARQLLDRYHEAVKNSRYKV